MITCVTLMLIWRTKSPTKSVSDGTGSGSSRGYASRRIRAKADIAGGLALLCLGAMVIVVANSL
jgi:hypothetical protein